MAVPETETDGVSAMSGLVGWIGALSSMALIGGLIWWSYDLATRDARSVPVVRAMEGPMSVPPETPGGYQAAHRGLAVNQVASEGEAAPLSEKIALAPEPTGVTEEDKPQSELADPADPDVIRNSVNNALDEIRAALGDAADVPEPPDPAPGEPALSQPDTLPPPRPAPRPDPDLVTRASLTVSAPASAPAREASAQLPTDGLAPGTRLVQLGAFDSLSIAEEEWVRLNERFADYMAGKKRLIEPAEIGERTIFRLRAYGFSDLAAARNFCSALIAENADCIPVLVR